MADSASRPTPEPRLDAPGAFVRAVAATLERGAGERRVARLLARDAALWTDRDEAGLLGWLELPVRSRARLEGWREAIHSWAGQHAPNLVLGMGGSSLGAEALARLGAREPGTAAELIVLDTTDPDQLAAIDRGLQGRRPLFFVSSKSGGTLETALLARYFRARYPASHFVAITDPGSPLERQAHETGFAGVLAGDADVGGRFSVLSAFGLAPALAAGIELTAVLDSAADERLELERLGDSAPAARLAAILSTALAAGRSRLSLAAPRELRPFLLWLEQLLAESLGKQGRGLLPVIDERPFPPAGAGDRLFVSWHPEDDPAAAALDALASAGHPVLRLPWRAAGLGAELYRWEAVTALVGASLGVHPFDQPDVEASKVATRAFVDRARGGDELPLGDCLMLEDLWLCRPQASGDSRNAPESRRQANVAEAAAELADLLRPLLPASLPQAPASGYLGLLAYLPMEPAVVEALERLRERLSGRLQVAVCEGFGPRYTIRAVSSTRGAPPAAVSSCSPRSARARRVCPTSRSASTRSSSRRRSAMPPLFSNEGGRCCTCACPPASRRGCGGSTSWSRAPARCSSPAASRPAGLETRRYS